MTRRMAAPDDMVNPFSNDYPPCGGGLRSGPPDPLFGYNKTRYRGLAKNENRRALLLGFANLLRGESCLV